LFGTTATHLAMLAQVRGEDSTLGFLKSLRANDVRVVGGNSHVRDLVARGDCDVGLTDTDDFWIGKSRGDPIAMAPAEKDFGSLGIIPNTCAIIKSGPHASAATRFVDWLLRPETEEMLRNGPSKQIPVRGLPKDPEGSAIDWDRLADSEEFLVKAKAALGL
jgi:iron(III) transport system substrate-binding protein